MIQPGEVLDLSYEDPAPPHDLVERARREGRRLRMRRQVGYGAAVASVAAVAIALGSQAGTFQGADRNPSTPAGVSSTDLGGLPSAVGRGPDAATLVRPSGHDGSSAWGEVHLMSPSRDADGVQAVVYVSTGADLCIGVVGAVGAAPRPAMCSPLAWLPEAGFASGVTYSFSPPPGATAHIMVAGLVRGGVSRVVVRTPRGDVEAQMAAAKDPRLGWIYWAQTSVPSDSAEEMSRIQRIAYQGTEPAFQCMGSVCARD